MNVLVYRLICLIVSLMMLPRVVIAQANIKAAFDAIIECPEAQVLEGHTLEKDPVKMTKVGQSDVYQFTLPASKIGLVKNVISAFDKDSDMAYSLKSGDNAGFSQIFLSAGDDDNEGIALNAEDEKYIYALYLAPQEEDSTGNYRYAYAMAYKEADGILTGKLVVTYAMTLKYRQSQRQAKQLKMLRSLSPDSSMIKTKDFNESQGLLGLFDTLMGYLRGFTTASKQTRIALATKTYNLLSNASQYPEFTEQDKTTAREILKVMIENPNYNDPILIVLLQQSLSALK